MFLKKWKFFFKKAKKSFKKSDKKFFKKFKKMGEILQAWKWVSPPPTTPCTFPEIMVAPFFLSKIVFWTVEFATGTHLLLSIAKARTLCVYSKIYVSTDYTHLTAEWLRLYYHAPAEPWLALG